MTSVFLRLPLRSPQCVHIPPPCILGNKHIPSSIPSTFPILSARASCKCTRIATCLRAHAPCLASPVERTRRPLSLHTPRWPTVRRPPRDRPPSAVRREARALVVIRREPQAQSIHASARAPSAARPSSRAPSSISDRDSSVLERPPRQSRPR